MTSLVGMKLLLLGSFWGQRRFKTEWDQDMLCWWNTKNRDSSTNKINYIFVCLYLGSILLLQHRHYSIQTMALWDRKRPLCQLSHVKMLRLFLVSIYFHFDQRSWECWERTFFNKDNSEKGLAIFFVLVSKATITFGRNHSIQKLSIHKLQA